MRLFTAGLFSLLVFAGQASAIVTLGLSNQIYSFTGIGANSAGQGQSKVSWGTCAFDGTNTTCTLSGPFTGLGPGGTYTLAVAYPGNGAFPLTAVSQTPGNDLIFFQSSSNFTFTMTLAESNGQTISFYSFANFQIFFSNATCTGVPSTSCGVGQVGLTPGATITGPVNGSFDPTPFITPGSVISASGYGAFTSVAPSTWMEIYGTNLATNLPPALSRIWAASDFNGSQAPLSLSGTTATIAGKPAPVLYVSPGQLNVQVPDTVPTGPQPLIVTTPGGSSAVYTINVNATEPGMLAVPAFILNGRQNLVAFFSNTLTYVLPVTLNGVKTARARPGDTLTLYGIGFGPVTPAIPSGQIVQQLNNLNASVQISFAGVPAQITYSGLVQSNVGLYQFNLVVPNVPASDITPVTVTVNQVPVPQSLYIAIQN